MEPRKNTLTVCKGEYFEISLMSNSGSTGYDWCISELSGPVLFIGEYTQEIGPTRPGSPHKKIFNFIASDMGSAKVEMKLLRPWAPNESMVVNDYTINIEESHTEDELKKFISEDNFPKTPILKYGFIPTSSLELPKVYYGVMPGNYFGSQNKAPWPLYGMYCTYDEAMMPYGVYNPMANKDKDLRVVGVSENDSRCMVKYGSPDPNNINSTENCNLKYGFMIDISNAK